MRIFDKFSPKHGSCGIVSAVTLGTFDGVHIGHREILERVVRRARESHIESAVVTFDRHPSAVLKPEAFPGLLTTLEEKIDFFTLASIGVTCILEFTKQMASMDAGDFIRNYLIGCLGMKWFVVGYDHGFGRGRGTTSDDLKRYGTELGFSLETVAPVNHAGTLVKSSVIRAKILGGDVEGASELLGRKYSLSGRVVRGTGNGKIIGFPTANIQPDVRDKLIPGAGVYAGWVTRDSWRALCVISISSRPTFGIIEEAIEIHIPGFSGDLYGEPINIEFSRKLRDIIKFQSPGALAEQIQRDIETTHHLFVS